VTNQPDDPDTFVLSDEDLPEGVRDAIARAVEARLRERLDTHVDHGFLLQRARAAGWDAKRLKKYYPAFPKWVRQELLDGKLGLDANGFLHELH
jgi:hypothetical protein